MTGDSLFYFLIFYFLLFFKDANRRFSPAMITAVPSGGEKDKEENDCKAKADRNNANLNSGRLSCYQFTSLKPLSTSAR